MECNSLKNVNCSYLSHHATNCHVNTTRNEIARKETFARVFIPSKQKWLAFTEWAVFLGPPTKQDFISFRLQWTVMWEEFLSWWVEISFPVSCKLPVSLKSLGCYFIAFILLEIISFRVIRCHVNTTQNEIVRKETFFICFYLLF